MNSSSRRAIGVSLFSTCFFIISSSTYGQVDAINRESGEEAPAKSDAPFSLDEPRETQPPKDDVEAMNTTNGFLCWPEPATLSGPLSTDRPGFADATAVMPRGHAQMELGYTYTFDSENRVRSWDHTVAQTNLRIGLIDNLEFRTLWGGYSMTEVEFDNTTPWAGRTYRDTDHVDGANDMTLGLRTSILKNDGLVPDLSFLTNLSIPVGTNTKTAGDVVPDVRLAYGWAITPKLRLYGVGIAAAAVNGDDRFVQASGSTALGYAITDRIGAFVEYYGIYPGREDEDCSHNADGGFTFLINDNCQFDISAGLGLNEQAPDYFIGMGLSFRW